MRMTQARATHGSEEGQRVRLHVERQVTDSVQPHASWLHQWPTSGIAHPCARSRRHAVGVAHAMLHNRHAVDALIDAPASSSGEGSGDELIS